MIANKINLFLVVDQYFLDVLDYTTTISEIRYSSSHFCSCRHEQLFVRSLKRRYLNHDCALHTQRVFTQNWLNSYYWLLVLSCLFICICKQSDKYSWSKMFVFSLSRELYRDFIAVCVFILPVVAFTIYVAIFEFSGWITFQYASSGIIPKKKIFSKELWRI